MRYLCHVQNTASQNAPPNSPALTLFPPLLLVCFLSIGSRRCAWSSQYSSIYIVFTPEYISHGCKKMQKQMRGTEVYHWDPRLHHILCWPNLWPVLAPFYGRPLSSFDCFCCYETHCITFPTAITKCPARSNLMKEGLFLAYSSRYSLLWWRRHISKSWKWLVALHP